jgi:hypothetical protein
VAALGLIVATLALCLGEEPPVEALPESRPERPEAEPAPELPPGPAAVRPPELQARGPSTDLSTATTTAPSTLHFVCAGQAVVLLAYTAEMSLYSVYLTDRFQTPLLLLGVTQMAGDVGGGVFLLYYSLRSDTYDGARRGLPRLAAACRVLARTQNN